MGRRCLPEGPYAWLPSLRPGRDDWQTLLDSVAQLYVRGAKIDWAGFDRDYQPRKVELPLILSSGGVTGPPRPMGPPARPRLAQRGGRILHPLLGRRLVAASSEQIFEAQLFANRPATLADHKIQGLVVMPGAGYLEMALAASAALHGKPWNVCGAMLIEPLLLDKSPKTVQTIFRPMAPARRRSASSAWHSPPPTQNRSSPRSPRDGSKSPRAKSGGDDRRGRRAQPLYRRAARRTMADRGAAQIGPRARTDLPVDSAPLGPRERGAGRAPSRARRRPRGRLSSSSRLARLAASSCWAACCPAPAKDIDAYVPMGVDRIQCLRSPRRAGLLSASIKSLRGNVAVGDMQMLDALGTSARETRRRAVAARAARLAGPPAGRTAARLVLSSWPGSLQALEPLAPRSSATSAEPGAGWCSTRRTALAVRLAERLEMKGAPRDAGAGRRGRRVSADRGPRVLASAASGTPAHRLSLGLGRRRWRSTGLRSGPPATAGAASWTWCRPWPIRRGRATALVAGDPRCPGRRRSPLPLSLAQSPVWGLGRVIAAEHPRLACTRIDLDPEDRRDAADQLAEESVCGQGEDQVVVPRRPAPRALGCGALRHGEPVPCRLPDGQPYRLEITSRGQLDNVTLAAGWTPTAGPGQVEIRVRATGLNFRDVLNVLDLYPGDPGPLGGECAGEIAAVGPGVEHFKPGDRSWRWPRPVSPATC